MLTIRSSSGLVAEIEQKGAELRRLFDGSTGTEYIWYRDPDIWPDSPPILFPFVARLVNSQYSYRGRIYDLPIHGFAKDSIFSIVRKTENSVTFELKDTDETLKVYPFHFTFQVIYTVEGRSLSVRYHVRNNGDEVMYFGLGSHPGFNVPLEKGLSFEDYAITFPKAERLERIIFTPDCFVTDEVRPYSAPGARIALSHDLFDDDAIVLRGMGGTAVLSSGKGERKVTVEFDGTEYLGLWHKVKYPAPYICIEPWYTLPGRAGELTDFESSDLLSLEAGDSTDRGYRITVG